MANYLGLNRQRLEIKSLNRANWNRHPSTPHPDLDGRIALACWYFHLSDRRLVPPHPYLYLSLDVRTGGAFLGFLAIRVGPLCVISKLTSQFPSSRPRRLGFFALRGRSRPWSTTALLQTKISHSAKARPDAALPTAVFPLHV